MNAKDAQYGDLRISNGRLFSLVTDVTFTYRPLDTNDIPEVSELIARVFDKFVAPECSSEGIREFHRYIQPGALRKRFRSNHFGVIAIEQDTIVGAIEMRGHHHISLLFVAPEFQHRGIARELLHQALLICSDSEPSLLEISVNSSSYAVPIYERLGFCKAGDRQVKNGICFNPMVLKLPTQNKD